MSTISTLQQMAQSGAILPEASTNFEAFYQASAEGSWCRASLDELVAGAHATEINDRFFKQLAFGTGGLRGRTIGRVVTSAEKGTPGALGAPEHPCVGSNAMNDFNVEKAIRGLCRYLCVQFPDIRPAVVLAHDTRHFSRHFAELCAKVANNEGVDAHLFSAERSTPQLSYTVRLLNAQAGVMITASHNPPHDNGFKAYFDDGGQVVEPHATNIVQEVNRTMPSGAVTPVNGATTRILGDAEDKAYLDALATLVLDAPMFQQQAPALKVVFTPIHGTGAISSLPILSRFGVEAITVPEQMQPDGRFPTVKSPNPENGEALAMGIALAKQHGADAVLATDPDCDRMGVALRNAQGDYELISGNQIGSIMAHYRVSALVQQGVLHQGNKAHACLIKTFVTTDLQAAIAAKFGIKLINTLTGFKYIGAKMRQYEQELVSANASFVDYRTRNEADKRAGHLGKGCYFIFGGEESYGYSGGDYVRDKDANAAVLMFVEALAFAKSQGISCLDYLDQIYAEFGYYKESLGNIVMEGAEGAAKIKRMLDSFDKKPPTEIMGLRVTRVQNFAKDTLHDIDGVEIPKELMLILHLENGARVAVRGSGTEPKVKFYFFAHENPAAGSSYTPEELALVKGRINSFIADLWPVVEKDAITRANS